MMIAMMTSAVLLLLPPVEDAGTVKGTVILKGTPPAAKKVRVDWSRAGKLYPSGLFIPPIPVDEEGHVRQCLVYVRKGLEGKAFEIPKEPLHINYDKSLLEPRMSAIMAGQGLVVENLDDDFHNIHALPWDRKNREFNEGLPEKGKKLQKTFAIPELGVKLKCDVHPWEECRVTVLCHPFFAVTDAKGQFEIKGLPPGKYTLEAWQENCLPALLEVDVKASETTVADFSPEPGPSRIDAWFLKGKPEEGKKWEGKIVAVYGKLQKAPGGNVRLLAGQSDWSGICRVKKDSMARIQAIPDDSTIVLRGRFKGVMEVDGYNFVMEECELEVAMTP